MRKLGLIIFIFILSTVGHTATNDMVTQEQLYGVWKYNITIPYLSLIDKNEVPLTEYEAMKEISLIMKGTQTFHRNNSMSDRGTVRITMLNNDLIKLSCDFISEFLFFPQPQELVEKIIFNECEVLDRGVLSENEADEFLRIFNDDSLKHETTTNKLHYISQDKILTTEIETGISTILERKKY